jgi:hypothetical protein
MKSNTVNIPVRADTNVLAKHRVGKEPLVILCIPDIGNTGSFDLRGRDGKTLILKWESKRNGHIIKIPASLWHQDNCAMAKSVLDQRRSGHSFVVTFDEYQSPEMGAVVEKSIDTVVGSTVMTATAPASIEVIPLDDVDDAEIDGPPDGVIGTMSTTEETMPLYAIVATYIQRNGSSRMKQVESDLEVPASEIRASLEFADSPVELSGGWVKFKD